MTSASLTHVVVIAAAAVLAPLLVDRFRRWLVVPATVLEITLGIVLGPAVLGLADTDLIVDALANFGLAMLFFLAGYELNFALIRGGPLRRALGSWAASLVLALVAGAVLAMILGGGATAAFGLGLALTTTALGTLLPMVRDSGLLRSPVGPALMAVGAVGEFAPIIMVAVLLSGDRPAHATVLLVGFLIMAVAATALATQPLPPWLARPLTATLGTSAQLAVRLSMLVVLAMVWLATGLHLDLVLGAFAAGVVIRQLLGSISRREVAVVESKLEGIGYGLLVPFFFVTTGVRFDLAALLGSANALVLVPIGLVGFLLLRGGPVAIAFRHQPGRSRLALALYAATALPMVVVITDTGVAAGWLSPATAAGLVGAAMLSVLVFPLAAQQVGPDLGSDIPR